MTELPEDFRDLLVELADAGADFVVIGGHAVAFHGHPRATKDLDVLVRADPENAAKVYRALAGFGAPLSSFEVREDDFATYGSIDVLVGAGPAYNAARAVRLGLYVGFATLARGDRRRMG